MAIAFVYVSADGGVTWTPWDGSGGGGGGGNVTVVSWTATEAVTVETTPGHFDAVVTGQVSLAAGAASIGTLGANAGVNIGSVALLAATGVDIGNVGLKAAQTLATLTDVTNPVGLKAIATTGPDVFTNLRAASQANLGGATANFPGGALMMTRPGDWSNVSDPGAATKATTTRAAPGSGKAHVVTSITGCVLAVNAQTGLTLSLTDGTLGVIWATKFLPPTGQGRDFQITGLNILISSNAAVTLDFNAAPAAGNFQSCAMTGYTLSS